MHNKGQHVAVWRTSPGPSNFMWLFQSTLEHALFDRPEYDRYSAHLLRPFRMPLAVLITLYLEHATLGPPYLSSIHAGSDGCSRIPSVLPPNYTPLISSHMPQRAFIRFKVVVRMSIAEKVHMYGPTKSVVRSKDLPSQ